MLGGGSGVGWGVEVSLELKWPGREGSLLLLDPYCNSPALSLSSRLSSSILLTFLSPFSLLSVA